MGANSYVSRSYKEKTGNRAFPSLSLIGLKPSYLHDCNHGNITTFLSLSNKKIKISNRKLEAEAARSSHRRCSVKKVLLNILQISQENTGVGVSFSLVNKVIGLEAWSFFKKSLQHRCFEEHVRATASEKRN